MTGRLLLVAFLLVAPSAHAQGSALERAQAAYDDLDFEQAVKLFRSALRDPGTREQRLRAWRGLALASAFVGDRKGAQKAFEVLLMMDPAAEVNTGLGPKVTRPWEEAKRAPRGPAPDWRISRNEETGEVIASLKDAPAAVDELKLYVHPDGRDLKVQAGPASSPVVVAVSAKLPVRAWAEALDDAGGVLFEAGTRDAPVQLGATAQPTAVAVAVDDAREQTSPSWDDGAHAEVSPSSRWPLWVGGAVAVVGGGVAAYFLTRPQALHLPPADRTGRLP